MSRATSIFRRGRLPVDEAMVLRGQGIRMAPGVPQAKGRVVDLARRALELGSSLAEPSVAYRTIAVGRVHGSRVALAGRQMLAGALVAERLAAASDVVFAVATLGPRLVARTAEAARVDVPFAMALEGYAVAALRALCDMARATIAAFDARRGDEAGPLFSPGMDSWDLADGQRQIFALVDAHRIGVTLTDLSLMLPRASTSFAFALGEAVRDDAGSCDRCPASPRCAWRVA